MASIELFSSAANIPTNVGSPSISPSPQSGAIPRSILFNPRLLISLLLFLTLTATFIIFTIFTGTNEVHTLTYHHNKFVVDDDPLANSPRWKMRPEHIKIATMVNSDGTNANGEPAKMEGHLVDDIMAIYPTCHNSIQGRKLVTDDAGAICARSHLLRNGCCRSTKRIDMVSTRSSRERRE